MGGASSSSLSDSQLKSRLQRMDDYDFEHLIADLWERQGWRTTVKQQSVDRGVDVVAERDDPFPQKWLIQAKCYSGTIGGPDVRQYVSLQHRPGVDGAIVVSSGPFSKQARQEEKDHNLKLIDGDGLIALIKNTNSYDLVDQYITIESTSSQSSESSSIDSSYSSEQSSFDLSSSSESVSSNPSDWSRHSKATKGWTRMHEYFDKIQTGDDIEEGITGLHRILFEKPPRGNWWKVIAAISGFWVFFFFVGGSPGNEVLAGIVTIGVLVSWFLLPIAIYCDTKVAPEYTANWNPKRWVYVIGSLIPLGGLIAGPTYLGFRWWYGTNRELDNAEELRSNFREIIDEFNEIIDSVEQEYGDQNNSRSGSSTDKIREENISETDIGLSESGEIERPSVNEYRKHAEFLALIQNNDVGMRTESIQNFLQVVIDGMESGDMSSLEYFRAKQDLQESIDQSRNLVQELKNTPPSPEFERTVELHKAYLNELENLNSELEDMIAAVESNRVNVEMMHEIIEDIHSISDTSSKLSDSLNEDVKEIKSFAESFN